ncbi:hypothetical protein [Paraburkholderia strydomiana]|uniref:hypothetical protein n=1 Tax=Paraburkholderia strydomiana TaxID=1245417 RepID=UPI0028620806|nr:hypothetical protein [Paraburkholderia strydomiana]MDR7007718.1 hypothetical protein [Paraburkholderia strydomiana]
MDNPIVSYIKGNLEYFTEESKRLADKGVLQEYWSLASRFLEVERKLGTSDHETAMRILAEDFIRARSAVVRDWNETWHSFFRWRAESKERDREQRQSQDELERILAEMEALTLKDDAIHSEAAAALNAHLKSVLEVARATVETPPIRFSGLPRALLLIDLRAFSVYLRYLLARCAFLFLRHSFIVFVLVFVCGTLYSKSAAALASLAAEHVAALSGRIAFIVFAAAVAKRYLLDPRLKRLQVKLESRWLTRLALKLHSALTLELTSRTARRRQTEKHPVGMG